MRTEPAPSVPTARLPMPTASAATPPPDEPPGVRPIFHGLWVAPNRREVGDALPAIFRRGRLAEQHGARLAQALRHRRVDGPRPVGVGREAAHARRQALGQHHVLDGDRHAVDVGQPLAALLPALLRGARGAQRAVGIEMLEGVELRIERLDAGDRGLRRLDRRGLARLVELDQLMRRHHREIGGHCLVSGRTGNFERMVLGIARGGAQHSGVLEMAGHDLQADRQAGAAEAARHRGGGMARQVERRGVGRPQRVGLAVRPVGQVLQHLEGLHARRWASAGSRTSRRTGSRRPRSRAAPPGRSTTSFSV